MGPIIIEVKHEAEAKGYTTSDIVEEMTETSKDMHDMVVDALEVKDRFIKELLDRVHVLMIHNADHNKVINNYQCAGLWKRFKYFLGVV